MGRCTESKEYVWRVDKMIGKFINPKTGRKEKHYQCTSCFEWIPFSDDNHKCKFKGRGIFMS